MKVNKLSIRYIIAKNRTRKDLKAPLMCRLTYLEKRKPFSTGQFVNPKHWNSKKQKVLDKAEQSEYVNSQLNLIKSKINRFFLMLQIQEISFSAEDIYKLYKGDKLERDYNAIEFFKHRLNKLKTLINIDVMQVTWNKYSYVKNDVERFIKMNEIVIIPTKKLIEEINKKLNTMD